MIPFDMLGNISY